MEKAININIGGRAFLITEDAYNKQNDYLQSIGACFKNNESGQEITDDIEARISELCEERMSQSHARIIDVELVNEMINRIGKPEAMMEKDGEDYESSSEENRQDEKKGSDFFEKLQLNKKYYLNNEERMLGGVISGLAAYLNFDVTILRIIAVIALALSGVIGILIYLVVWCIAPVATTTTDKLRMQGVEPTPEKIADKITNEATTSKKEEPETTNSQKEDRKKMILAIVLAIATFIIIKPDYIDFQGTWGVVFAASFTATLVFSAIFFAFRVTDAMKGKFNKTIKILIIISFITFIVSIIKLLNIL